MLLFTLAVTLVGGTAQPPAAAAPEAPIDWKSAEGASLANHVQLTFPEKFVKAGEAYFDHQKPPQSIIFQAIPVPEAGKSPDANYSMYVARLKRDASSRISGIEEPLCVSPAGSANTCGWIHPLHPDVVNFGSTFVAPAATDSPGYSRDKARYSWQFPQEMEIATARIPAANSSGSAEPPHKLFTRPGYDAEGSFSSDGRFYLYTHVDPTNNDPNLWIFDTKLKTQTPIVTTKGYDGGPFFSPDGKWICFRSDRRGDNNLQLFAGELAFGNDGDAAAPVGLAREVQLTDDKDIVNWCPFWHPSGKFMVYASSAVSHSNYEVFAIEFDPSKDPKSLARTRITHATGFDGLPVFSDDGKLMMWTSQRGPKLEKEQRSSSQLWVAEWIGLPAAK